MKHIEPKIWVTSDTHFNHAAQIKLNDRPEDFEERIYKGLASIPAKDTLLHLGDVCIGRDEAVHERFIRPLKCKKVLIRGNHDGKSDSWYLAHGWDFVCDGIVLKKYGKKILFTHVPSELAKHYDGNVHGHMHRNKHRVNEFIANGTFHLFSQEFNNYQPMLLSKIIEEKPNII